MIKMTDNLIKISANINLYKIIPSYSYTILSTVSDIPSSTYHFDSGEIFFKEMHQQLLNIHRLYKKLDMSANLQMMIYFTTIRNARMEYIINRADSYIFMVKCQITMDNLKKIIQNKYVFYTWADYLVCLWILFFAIGVFCQNLIGCLVILMAGLICYIYNANNNTVRGIYFLDDSMDKNIISLQHYHGKNTTQIINLDNLAWIFDSIAIIDGRYHFLYNCFILTN